MIKQTIKILLIILLLSINSGYSQEYTTKEICQAIWHIEGGKNTKYPYGIKSVSCNGKEECKQICWNTIENNRIRYAQYGYKEFKTYLEFLASRYCPLSEDKCENWLPNLKRKLKEKK